MRLIVLSEGEITGERGFLRAIAAETGQSYGDVVRGCLKSRGMRKKAHQY